MVLKKNQILLFLKKLIFEIINMEKLSSHIILVGLGSTISVT